MTPKQAETAAQRKKELMEKANTLIARADSISKTIATLDQERTTALIEAHLALLQVRGELS